jgi:hypothetical protein
MSLRARRIRTISSLAFLCVAAAAAPALAVEPAGGAPGVAEVAPGGAEVAPGVALSSDLGGRWQGPTYELSRRAGNDCEGSRCKLTLDIVKCASGWCGVEVLDAGKRCGATALTLETGTASGGAPQYRGKLSLAQGTEPYVVEAYLMAAAGDAERELQIVGDTGGEFRMFRRSFPFNATLVRAGEPACKPESTVSLLD